MLFLFKNFNEIIIFLTASLFFHFKLGLFFSREEASILNEPAPEPTIVTAGH